MVTAAVPAPSTRGQVRVLKGGNAGAIHPNPEFGTRAVERVQAIDGFEGERSQGQIAFLIGKGYTAFAVTAEKILKDYIAMDDPQQATDRLGQSNGALVPTMYFQMGVKAAAGKSSKKK